MKSYIEFCNEQAEKLFQIIDQHKGLLKWRKSWQVQGCMSLPKSVNGYYRGVNLWNLLTEQIHHGLVSNTWLTFNQVKKQGGHVFKGAKGTQICFFKIKEVEAEEVNDAEIQKMIPLFRPYTVFNVDQTSLAGQSGATLQSPVKVQKLLSILGANVSEFGNQPCYKTRDDVIVMPKRQFFNSTHDYDVTLLHELVHWTGHPARLNRDSIKNYSMIDAARAEEELVAEIGSVFLAGHLGLVGELVNHASYVACWKKYLDAKALARAMRQASKAFHWLINQQ